MKIAVLMMFRDEEDILERCLEHWLQVCPSVNFYLVDNLSKDRSYEIASKFTTCIFKENKNDWPGRENYNRLHHIARKEGCDWYFPADADEFLNLPICYNTVEEWFEDMYSDVEYAHGELPYLNVLPNGWTGWQQPHRKVFGKFSPDDIISMGNHLIEGGTPTLYNMYEGWDSTNSPDCAYYKHYSLRSIEQFKNKMINYMEAFHQSVHQSHPHAKDWFVWQEQGEQFFIDRWNALTIPYSKW